MPDASKMRSFVVLDERRVNGKQVGGGGGRRRLGLGPGGQRQPHTGSRRNSEHAAGSSGFSREQRRAAGFQILRIDYRRPRPNPGGSIERSLRCERIGKGKYDEDSGQYRREQRLSLSHFLTPGLRFERQGACLLDEDAPAEAVSAQINRGTAAVLQA